MQLKQAQYQVDQWIKETGVRYFDVLTNTAVLMEEVGEFARLAARVYGDQSFKNLEDEEKATVHIEEELGDILFVLICLSNQMGVDLDTAFSLSMKKKNLRDKDRHKNNPKLRE